jgi:hypothetical protein
LPLAPTRFAVALVVIEINILLGEFVAARAMRFSFVVRRKAGAPKGVLGLRYWL